MTRRNQDFQTIKSEGGLLPPDLLRRLVSSKDKLQGTDARDYGLAPGERLNDAITQSWNKLRKHWTDFRKSARDLPEGEPGTSLTNEKWSVPLLRELGFGMLPTSAAPVVAGKTYAINRFFGATAVHLIGCQLDLDRRAKGVRGAAMANPHGLVQDFLNRSDAHLWAILSNGLRLRILRDSQAISRQSYLEFDLEPMFDGEIYADFVVLWMVGHSTRFAARENEKADSCWLERWTKLAEEQGTRALGDLKHGVEKALEVLGQGFVGHPKNAALREALRTGRLPLADLHGQLLRIVYRLIFLFVAEDRTLEGMPLLHPRDDSDTACVARDRYAKHYSAGRLREMANEIRGSRHGDLWWQLSLVFGALSDDERQKAARERLALPVLGSFLWSPESTAALNAPSIALGRGTELANVDLLEAVRDLAFTRQHHSLRPVDYKNLGAEELGGVYESLLALTPQISGDGVKFTFAEFAGNERKTSGSYYTPDSLVQCLLDSALEPVIEEAVKGKRGEEAENAILSLKVCDPAVGSGHFLVGAAHRLARHLARIRAAAQGEGEPSPSFYQHALRDVIGRCLYGVDINPMAAELCRVSLWLEALDPGKPMSFLDHHIRVGNSLLGTTPELIAAGLPDDAFKEMGDDDKKVCTQLRKQNKAEREGFGQHDFVARAESSVAIDLGTIAKEARSLDSTPDDTIDGVHRKADRFSRLVVSPEFKQAQQAADAWCAAFMWPKTVTTLSDVVTTGVLSQLATNPNALTARQRQEIERLSGRFQYFHWHLAFPDVFANSGFDCVLGNPPWEQTELKEKEWFAESRPDIADARTGAQRKRMIEDLKRKDPETYAKFFVALREHDSISRYLKDCDRFPLCGRGRTNLYAVFAEGMRQLLNRSGRAGCVLPTGIATDDTTKLFFQEVVDTRALVSLFDFENKGLFQGVDSRFKFCLFTSELGLRPTAGDAEFFFFAHSVEDLRDAERRFTLSVKDIALLNPNSRTCPIFRSKRDAELTKAIYRRMPVLIREARHGEPNINPWHLAFKQGLFNMTSDSNLFRTRDQLLAIGGQLDGNIFRQGPNEYLPLYEAKMVDFFDHRAAHVVLSATATVRQGQPSPLSADEHRDPYVVPIPRSWVARNAVDDSLREVGARRWFLGLRDITSATNERTVIASALPFCGVGNNLPILILDKTFARVGAALLASLNSYSLDFTARFKVGGLHLNFFIVEQFPVPAPSALNAGCAWDQRATRVADWLLPRVLELTYTAWDLESFAKDCGFNGPPFRWDEDRRVLIRAELDAAFFHLYLPSDSNGEWVKVEFESEEDLRRLKESFSKPRDAVDYIMETFPIVKKKDIEKYGDYRTKLQILKIYDEMQKVMEAGTEYNTKLDPPPGDPRCCHPATDKTKH